MGGVCQTLFLSVAYLDRLLLLKPHIERQVFQLYGLTCLWIASKYEDTLSNPIADLVWICDDAYSRQQFEHCEMEVLITLEWRVAQVTTRCFVEETLADSKVGGAPSGRWHSSLARSRRSCHRARWPSRTTCANCHSWSP